VIRDACLRRTERVEAALIGISTPTSEVLLALPARPDAARQARRELLTRGLDEDISHTVTLLTTELIANAIRHADMDPARDRIVFFGRLAPDLVHIEVGDSGPGFSREDVSPESGFGMRLLSKLASRWGCERSGQGFRVWFEVDRRRRRFQR
jgi:anti-sigma regulatory factor (Ser/Thr protein kinase)